MMLAIMSTHLPESRSMDTQSIFISKLQKNTMNQIPLMNILSFYMLLTRWASSYINFKYVSFTLTFSFVCVRTFDTIEMATCLKCCHFVKIINKCTHAPHRTRETLYTRCQGQYTHRHTQVTLKLNR